MTDNSFLPQLLRHFESLGNNCEFGIVQRAAGYDPPGLFRNVGFLQTSQIVDAIGTGLDGMFEHGCYGLSRQPGWQDYTLSCKRYGFMFHTAVSVNADEAEAEAAVKKFRFLKRLFLEALASGDKIFVYRHNEAAQTERALADALLAALRRHGPNWLLFVARDQRPEQRFTYADPVADGLIMGGMPQLSKENPPIINFAGWEKLTRLSLGIRSAAHRDNARSATAHQAPAPGDAPLFELTIEGVMPGSALNVQSEIALPANFDGSGVNLVALGYESLRAQGADLAKRDTWQTVGVSALVPGHANRAVAVLRSIGGSVPANIPSRNWRIRLEPLRRTYKVVRWTSLDAIEQVVPHPDIDIKVAPITFGDTVRPHFPVTEYPPDGWHADRIAHQNIASISLRDARIHGEQGIVTIGDTVLFETLRLAAFQDDGLRWEGQGMVSLPAHEPTLSLNAAAHIFSGFPGVHSYAHFLVDMLPAAFPPFTGAGQTLLWPFLRHAWQRGLLRMTNANDRSVFLHGSAVAACERLHLSPLSLIDSGHFPHPLRMAAVACLKNQVPLGRAARRLYISGKDSRLQSLLNEDEIISMLARHGFEALELTALPVASQIQAFAEASCVVAPHGAGNANVIFCAPGTPFCELLSDLYVQWSMRRLASVVPLRYGCVIGRADRSQLAANEAQLPWRVDVDRVEAAVRSALT